MYFYSPFSVNFIPCLSVNSQILAITKKKKEGFCLHRGFLSYVMYHQIKLTYSETCVKRPLSKRPKNCFFKTNYRLMQVKSIAECFTESILQYFQPSLSYQLSLRSLFCLFFEWPFYTGLTVHHETKKMAL